MGEWFADAASGEEHMPHSFLLCEFLKVQCRQSQVAETPPSCSPHPAAPAAPAAPAPAPDASVPGAKMPRRRGDRSGGDAETTWQFCRTFSEGVGRPYGEYRYCSPSASLTMCVGVAAYCAGSGGAGGAGVGIGVSTSDNCSRFVVVVSSVAITIPVVGRQRLSVCPVYQSISGRRVSAGLACLK